MKILIVCVNFNSYDELDKYLKSIDVAISKSTSTEVSVIVADNSPQMHTIDFGQYENVNVRQQGQGNIGYLPGATNVLNNLDNISVYDYIVVSNVDLIVNELFFQKLENKVFDKDVAWVATQIWTEREGRDKNPKIVERCSKKRLRTIRLLYKYPILDYLYTNTLYLRKKVRPQFSEQNIYAGHGSFMMLTKRFFEEYNKIDYPIFLFGEEIFLAELIRNRGLKVRYVPDLCVNDNEHSSTSRMRKKEYYKYNLQSIDYILKEFYYE